MTDSKDKGEPPVVRSKKRLKIVKLRAIRRMELNYIKRTWPDE